MMMTDLFSFPWAQEDLKKLLLNPRLSEQAILERLKELSQTFTIKRHQLPEYGKSQDLVSAYTYFYLPTNFAKFFYLIEKLPRSVVEELLSANFVDVGAGAGTFSLAFLRMLEHFQHQPSSHQKLLLLDQSPSMLSQAKILIEDFLKRKGRLLNPEYVQQSFLDFKGELNRMHPVILCFGHALNEMNAEQAIQKITAMNADYVMLIEPGTKESFQKVRQLRARLQQDYDILYPCPLSSAPCALENEKREPIEIQHWCHQVMKIQLPPLLQQLADKLKMNRQILPLIGHFYRKKNLSGVGVAAEIENKKSVLLQYQGETKYSFPLVLCRQKKGKNVVVSGELLKKNYTVAEKKQIKYLQLGDRISIAQPADDESIVLSKRKTIFELDESFFHEKVDHDDPRS